MENHLEGLPKYGVTLSGSPLNPVIENHSGRTVIAYMLIAAGQNGCGPVYQILLTTTMQPAGIPDGGSLYAIGAMPINRPGPMQSPASARIVSPGHGPIVSATLQSVVFADGQFLGADEHGVFELFGRRIKVIVDVGLLAKAGAWDQLEPLALSPGSPLGPPADFERRSIATLLVHERRFKGDDAADELAKIFSSLPAPWRH
jgi:hypothetical protein